MSAPMRAARLALLLSAALAAAHANAGTPAAAGAPGTAGRSAAAASAVIVADCDADGSLDRRAAAARAPQAGCHEIRSPRDVASGLATGRRPATPGRDAAVAGPPAATR